MGGSPSKSGSRCNTLTAANGDMLVLSMVGRGGSDPTHGFGTSTVVGGTGQFQGTTGSYEQAITFALLPPAEVNPYTDRIEGTIALR